MFPSCSISSRSLEMALSDALFRGKIYVASLVSVPSPTMEPLSALIQKVPVKIRKDILASCVVFPKTASLSGDNPLVTHVMEPTGLDNYEHLKKFVREHPEFISLSLRDDLLLTLQVLKEIHEELQLDKFDGIQIYRGGLDVLLIVNKGRQSGRTAYVEINDYRRRLHQLLNPEFSPWFIAIISAGAVAAAMAAFQLWMARPPH